MLFYTELIPQFKNLWWTDKNLTHQRCKLRHTSIEWATEKLPRTHALNRPHTLIYISLKTQHSFSFATSYWAYIWQMWLTELIQRNRGKRCEAQIMGRRHEHTLDCRQLTCASRAGKEFRLKIKINWAYRTSHWVPVCVSVQLIASMSPQEWHFLFVSQSFASRTIDSRFQCDHFVVNFRCFPATSAKLHQISATVCLSGCDRMCDSNQLIPWETQQNNGRVSKITQLNSQEMGKCGRNICLCMRRAMPMMPMSSRTVSDLIEARTALVCSPISRIHSAMCQFWVLLFGIIMCEKSEICVGDDSIMSSHYSRWWNGKGEASSFGTGIGGDI